MAHASDAPARPWMRVVMGAAVDISLHRAEENGTPPPNDKEQSPLRPPRAWCHAYADASTALRGCLPARRPGPLSTTPSPPQAHLEIHSLATGWDRKSPHRSAIEGRLKVFYCAP